MRSEYERIVQRHDFYTSTRPGRSTSWQSLMYDVAIVPDFLESESRDSRFGFGPTFVVFPCSPTLSEPFARG